MAISLEWVRAEAPVLLVLLASTLVYLGERRVHSYNYAYLTTVGAEELISSEMRSYFRFQLILPWVAYAASQLLPESLVLKAWPLVGLSLVMLGFVLKLWSMRSLGRLWSQACLYIPEMPREGSGPYRFVKHPEYLARAGEGLGLLLLVGLNPIGFLLWLRMQVLLIRIVKVEGRQLRELSAAPLPFPDPSSTVGASKL